MVIMFNVGFITTKLILLTVQMLNFLIKILKKKTGAISFGH